MKSTILILALATAALAPAAVPDNPVFPRPVVVPQPQSTAGVPQAVISLNGAWKVSTNAPAEFWSNSVDPSSWQDIQLPSHAIPQGVVLPRGSGGQYAFKKKIAIPAAFAGKRILVQFDGVTGEGKAWINGVHLRDHFGGFTTWQCDITQHVTPGSDAWLTVAATDANLGLIGYDNGGILRSIRLIAVPQDYLTRLNIETVLDSSYRDAVLKVWVALAFHQGQTARVDLRLRDPQGRAVALNPATVTLTRDNPETIVEIPVRAPVKWDAEHPNLYTLEAAIPGGVVSKKVGFRKVERVGKHLLVNGQEVKLRGINRKDIYPLTGRSVPLDILEKDILLFRAANINYIRTSHYPTNPEFLEAADKHGMYIESENAISFARDRVASNPEVTHLYLSQLSEMIERDRSHPSVIIWSLGNESSFGSNVERESEYARAEDPTRPLKFSWSHLVPPEKQEKIYDLYSFHYASDIRDLAAGGPLPGGSLETNRERGDDPTGFPVIHDEYAHVAAYINAELRRDPNVRNFWGHALKIFWERMFPREGALGGAIWGSVDNSSIAPEDRLVVSRSDWGLIDGWRRPKPEYWLTQKAYSPVRIEDKPVANPGAGRPLDLPIKNWFDHTNLNELRIVWRVGSASGQVTPPAVAPHAEGTLRIPARAWKDGDVLNLKFFRMGEILVDEYNLPVNPPARTTVAAARGAAPAVEQQPNAILVKGANFDLTFSRQTGLITSGIYAGTKIIESGPYLNLVGEPLGAWSLKSIRAEREATEAVVFIDGAYGSTEVQYQVRVDSQGLITTRYKLGQLPPVSRRLVAQGYQRDVGGYWELGVSYILTGEVDRLSWERKGLWSAYPEDHIGRNSGTARREGNGGRMAYGVKPEWNWSEDERDFILFSRYDIGGRGSRDFQSMKENIYEASAQLRGADGKGIEAVSDGTAAVRMEVLPDTAAQIDFRNPALRWTGKWEPTATASRATEPGATVELTFQGTGIAWISGQETGGGSADIYIDGQLTARGLSVASRTAQNSALLFSKTGLAPGTHTLRLVSAGATGAPLSVEAFQVLGPNTPRGSVRFIVNNEWNYPNLGWGNWVKKPVSPEPGYTNEIRLRFLGATERSSLR